MDQLRQGVAALLGCPETGPQVPLSPGWKQGGQSSAQAYRVQSGLSYLLPSPPRCLSCCQHSWHRSMSRSAGAATQRGEESLISTALCEMPLSDLFFFQV